MRRGDDGAAVWAECRPPDLVIVPAQDDNLLAGGDVPQPRGLVFGGSHDGSPVGAKHGGEDRVLMATQDEHFVRDGIPQSDRSVPGGGGDCLAVGAEVDMVDRSLCPHRVGISCHPEAVHRRTVRSPDPVATVLPSGLNEVAIIRRDGHAGRRSPCPCRRPTAGQSRP